MAVKKIQNTKTTKDNLTVGPKKFRYYCHGCTKNAAFMEEATENVTVLCPHCGKQQVTKAENFIAI
jgi:Zn finger protein HypA/HybF involved in hydrogenase expression